MQPRLAPAKVKNKLGTSLATDSAKKPCSEPGRRFLKDRVVREDANISGSLEIHGITTRNAAK